MQLSESNVQGQLKKEGADLEQHDGTLPLTGCDAGRIYKTTVQAPSADFQLHLAIEVLIRVKINLIQAPYRVTAS